MPLMLLPSGIYIHFCLATVAKTLFALLVFLPHLKCPVIPQLLYHLLSFLPMSPKLQAPLLETLPLLWTY